MKKIIDIAGANSYVGTFDRLNKSDGIEIIENEDNNYYKVKFVVPDVKSNILLNIGNVYNPMVYWKSYIEEKPVCRCKVCGKEFIKEGNTKTCGKDCSGILQRMNQAKQNKKVAQQ